MCSVRKLEPEYKLEDEDLNGIFELQSISECKTCTFTGGFSFAGHNFSDHLVQNQYKPLSSNRLQITSLDLSSNSKIGEKGFVNLGDILEKNCTQKLLNLGECYGGNNGDR